MDDRRRIAHLVVPVIGRDGFNNNNAAGDVTQEGALVDDGSRVLISTAA